MSSIFRVVQKLQIRFANFFSYFYAVYTYLYPNHFAVIPSLDIDFEQQEIILGGPFDVNCTALGIPSPTVEWFKDGTPIASNGSTISITATIQTTDVGQIVVTSTLTITTVGIDDAGSYSCSATNDFGAQARTVAELVIHGE